MARRQTERRCFIIVVAGSLEIGKSVVVVLYAFGNPRYCVLMKRFASLSSKIKSSTTSGRYKIAVESSNVLLVCCTVLYCTVVLRSIFGMFKNIIFGMFKKIASKP
jgi:hypothetical protein